MPSIMFQGTGSDVGKSILAAAFCRVLTNKGYRVKPFKPQNMSNNAAPTVDGGEIGRAQALQALGCKVDPTTDMNPVLLKPESNYESQVIVQGKILGKLRSEDFNEQRGGWVESVMESFERLKSSCDIVVVEGAGSPAETNLRQGDIANMGFAIPAKVPVILIGDIDRGGVIAQIVGSKNVLDQADANQIKGFIINRFRGDLGIFKAGYETIERLSGWQGFGVVPWTPAALMLPEEDAVRFSNSTSGGAKIAIPLLPHISNHDDFDALQSEPNVELVLVRPGQAIPGDVQLVILPGSKSTIDDLAFFRAQGWDIDLQAHIRRGGYVLGICGGFQMLGRTISDPQGVEGASIEVDGLGLIAMQTIISSDKRITDVSGFSISDKTPFRGYEIHCGKSHLDQGVEPLLEFTNGDKDGAIGQNNQVFGCYVHRLFDDPDQRAKWLALLGVASDGIDQSIRIETGLEAMADVLSENLDIDGLIEIANQG
jgi:adenosylcobyric acid synthase